MRGEITIIGPEDPRGLIDINPKGDGAAYSRLTYSKFRTY